MTENLSRFQVNDAEILELYSEAMKSPESYPELSCHFHSNYSLLCTTNLMRILSATVE